MNELDQAIITLVSHNQVDELVHNGVQMEWVDDADARVMFRIGLELKHGSKKMVPNRVNLLTAAWGELKNQTEVKRLVSLNGTGEASAAVVADKLLNRYLNTNAKLTVSKLTQALSARPHETKQFLQQFAIEFDKLSTSGQAYDPRPSAHKGSIVPPIIFRSKLDSFNKIFGGKAQDGGGYRKGWWAVWMGATGRGKTEIAYTMSVDAILQDQKVVFISKERQEQVRARILLGLTGLTLDEIGKEKAAQQSEMRDSNDEVILVYDREGNPVGPWHDASTRQTLFDFYSDKLERLLRLYDWSFSPARQVRAIISAEKPVLVNGDFYDVTDVVGNDKVIGLGVISRENEKIAHETGVHFNGFFQIAAHEKAAYEKNDTHEILGPFSSSMVTQFADTVLQTKWDRQPNHQHIRRNKCRLGGLNDSYILVHDQQRWIYRDR